MILMKVFLPLFFSFLVNAAYAVDFDQTWQKLLKKHSLAANDQAYCTDLNGSIEGFNIDKPMNPASVTKLFVSLWAIKELGVHFQFETKFFYNQADNSLHIEGGGDPYFVSENILYILNQLNDAEIYQLDRVTFDENLLFNWSKGSTTIAQDLKRHFNTHLWTNALNQTLTQLLTSIEEQQVPLIIKKPMMRATSVSFRERPATEYTQVFAVYSQPLFRQLKQMNQFSNNFMAQAYFDYLGKSNELERFLKEEAGIEKKDAYFFNGSGLDNNYTTCRATLTVIKKLYQEIEAQEMKPQDVMAVSAADQGTLRDRFTDAKYQNTILAKTGTLATVSTLAGSLFQAKTHRYFAIFNSKQVPHKGRAFQDDFIEAIFSPDTSFPYAVTAYFPFGI